MTYGFETEEKHHALAALIIYVVYRSRNLKRFKVSTKMWEQITNFAKLSAKKSLTLGEFIERFRKPMCCETLQNRYCIIDEQHAQSARVLADGSVVMSGKQDKAFLTSLINDADDKKVLDLIYKETAFVIHTVRERLENEKNIINEDEE